MIHVKKKNYLQLAMFYVQPSKFSKLNKSKLRSTTTQHRLESLIFLFTEQEMASNIDVNLVINELNDLSKRRIVIHSCV